jgi:hypothetical protein
MIKFEGVILNSEIDSNGNIISKECLKSIAKQIKNIPIGFEFNPSIPPIYGFVKRGKFKNNQVLVEAEVEKPLHEVKMYIVPSFKVNKTHLENGINVLDEVELLEMSLTTQPSDRHLDYIKWRGENDKTGN